MGFWNGACGLVSNGRRESCLRQKNNLVLIELKIHLSELQGCYMVVRGLLGI